MEIAAILLLAAIQREKPLALFLFYGIRRSEVTLAELKSNALVTYILACGDGVVRLGLVRLTLKI